MKNLKQLLAERKRQAAENRAWHEDRNREGIRHAKIQAAEWRGEFRGVDRVPAHLRVDPPQPEYITEHFDTPYRERRSQARAQGQPMREGMNTPYRNPERAARKARRKVRR